MHTSTITKITPKKSSVIEVMIAENFAFQTHGKDYREHGRGRLCTRKNEQPHDRPREDSRVLATGNISSGNSFWLELLAFP